MTFQDIQSKINLNKALDFGDVFNKSIELFKKSWVNGLILQLFLILMALPFVIIIYAPLVIMMIAQQESGYSDTESFNTFFAGFSILYLVLIFVGIMIMSVVQLALTAGFFRVLKALDHNELVKTSDLFYFLKGKYFGRIVLLMLASFIIAVVAMLLCFIPIFYAMIPLSFFTIMFAFNPDLGTGDLVRLCFSIGTKKWLITFGLIFVASLLASFVGFLLCGIGAFVTAAFTYHPIYFIYKEVVGFDDDNEELKRIGNDTNFDATI
ncbi:MAG: hypothetical protein V7719_15765 [Psychroserpens sp.]|uniref:hypothetical protein n=1 Tax=Psychroserpens sp. TaxID=2020870 RepID=UPI0030028831